MAVPDPQPTEQGQGSNPQFLFFFFFLSFVVVVAISSTCYLLNKHISNILQKLGLGVPIVAQWLTNPTRNHEVVGSIPGLTQWVKGSGVAMSCGVGCRRGSDPTLLWLWCRPVATAPIRPLAWEPPYAVGVAQEIAKKKKFLILDSLPL